MEAGSGISKLEAGDRRVDVDDLTVIAYPLRTTPAALLAPPDEQTTLTGVPEGYEPEEIDSLRYASTCEVTSLSYTADPP